MDRGGGSGGRRGGGRDAESGGGGSGDRRGGRGGGPMSFGGDRSSATSDSMALASEMETGLLLKDESDIRSGSSSNHPPRAPRPGFCTDGELCVVTSNNFRVVTAPAIVLCKYNMVLSPQVKSRGLNRAILAELVKKDFFGGRLPAFDRENYFYTAQPLSFEPKDFPVKLRNQREFKVTVKFVDQVALSHIHQNFLGTKAGKALDAVLRGAPSLNYIAVPRSFFSIDLGESTDIGDNLESWRGYRQRLRLTQIGLLLNIDTLTAAFYKPVSVAEFAMDYLNICKQPRRLDPEGLQKLQQVLIGVCVKVTHKNKGVLQYNIVGLHMESLRNINYQLKYTDLPYLICIEKERPMFLPMEVCTIIGGQKFSKMLKKKQMRALQRAGRPGPDRRLIHIAEVVQHSNLLMEKLANQFGFCVEGQAVKVDARVLWAPTLKFHDTSEMRTCVPFVGKWNMEGKTVVHGGIVLAWACLNFSRVAEIARFCGRVASACNGIGMAMNQECFMYTYHNFRGTVDEDLKRIYSKFRDLQLLIVILPEEYTSIIYKYTKTVCDTQLGIASQCFLPKNVVKARKRYLDNVALKINLKVGGSNTMLEKPLSASWHDPDCATIIFGIDVNHPSPGDVLSPSIAAVVASMDWPTIRNYRSAFATQQPRQEIVSNLFSVREDPQKGTVYGGMIRELLIGYMRSTSVLPQRIIIYRGGVSEGQFSRVLLHELSAIRQACQSLQDGYEPKVTFVVLQKGHRTRFFPERQSGNILPGTVIDKKICHPSEFDFYLCSHAVLKGTSRPTHYHVLINENGFSANEIQVMTNDLCYTCAWCTRSLSIVPPVYYAHRVAARARCYSQTRVLGSLDGNKTESELELKMVPEFEPIPTIMKDLKKVMFYC